MDASNVNEESSLTEKLSNVFFTHLLAEMSEDVREELQQYGVQMLDFDEEEILSAGKIGTIAIGSAFGSAEARCFSFGLAPSVVEAIKWGLEACRSLDGHPSFCNLKGLMARFKKAGEAAQSEMTKVITQTLETLPHDDQLKTSFEVPYAGNAHLELAEFLDKSCIAGSGNSGTWNRYSAPYTTVLQSSGFGKSRLVYELAKHVATRTVRGSEFNRGIDIRVLYVCARSILSPGHPAGTGKLRQWIFNRWGTGSQLEAIYCYARQNWDAVGDEWLDLFSGDDTKVTINLDAALKGKPAFEKLPEGKERIVVIVVDDAEILLQKYDYDGRSMLRMLCRALSNVNRKMYRERSARAMMGVFVSSNPHIQLDINDHIYTESASHYIPTWHVAIPPFVLTQTMDGMHIDARESLSDLKAIFLDSVAAWEALVRMGRPLWLSYHQLLVADLNRNEVKSRTIELAATKLLGDFAIRESSNYSAATSYGVGALLC